MLQAMCGSLLQFVAVVAGANIWRPRLVAAVVHPLITAGAIFLASAFLLEQQVLFLVAALVFVAASGPVPDGHGDRAAAHAGARHEHSCAAPGRARLAGDGGAWAPSWRSRWACRKICNRVVAAGADQRPRRLGAGRLGADAGDRRLLSGGADVPADAGLSGMADAPAARRIVPGALPVDAAALFPATRGAGVAVRRGALPGCCSRDRYAADHALAAIAPPAPTDRCHVHLLARRDAVARSRSPLSWIAVRGAAATGRPRRARRSGSASWRCRACSSP